MSNNDKKVAEMSIADFTPKATVRRTIVKHKIIFGCFAYFGMMGDVVGQIVTHDCPDFTVQGASQPSARMECTVWGNRLTGLSVVNQDTNATWQPIDWCMCTKQVAKGSKLSCADYNQIPNTGFCQSVWNYGVGGTLYNKSITSAVYDNPESLAHEIALCTKASKEACAKNCDNRPASAKHNLKDGLTCRKQVPTATPFQ